MGPDHRQPCERPACPSRSLSRNAGVAGPVRDRQAAYGLRRRMEMPSVSLSPVFDHRIRRGSPGCPMLVVATSMSTSPGRQRHRSISPLPV